MTYLAVTSGLAIVGLIILLWLQGKAAQEERSTLLDRIMAMSEPEALIVHDAVRHRTEDQGIAVAYVDEAAEFQVERNGHVDLLGDD